MPKWTILIVDEDKILIDLLIGALSSNDLAVLGATTVEEGTRLLHRHAPALLVIDAAIANGTQLLESIRSGGLDTKVVAVTASGGGRDRAQAMGIGTIVERNTGLEGLAAAIRGFLGADVHVTEREGSVHVLIAEDEEGIRNLLAEFLRSKGYAVTCVKNGHEAIQQVKSNPAFQIALLDVSMPEMGGLEALNAIMACDPHPAVMMLTAVADSAIAQMALKAGAFDYILKPFDFSAIETSITAYLSDVAYKKRKSWWKR